MNDETLPQITVTEAMLRELEPMRPLSLLLGVVSAVLAVLGLIAFIVFLASGLPWLMSLPVVLGTGASAYVAMTFFGIAQSRDVDGPMIRQLDRNIQAIFLKVVVVPLTTIALVVALFAFAFLAVFTGIAVQTANANGAVATE